MKARNRDTAVITIGRPIAMRPDLGGAVLAQANSIDGECDGVAQSVAAPGAEFDVATDGEVSNADWTRVVGATGLVTGTRYYLDPDTAGKLTTTPPTTVGQIVQLVGVAFDGNAMRIACGDAIQL